MANTARLTQSFLIAGALQNGNARLTQSFIIAAIGLGISCGNPPAGIAGVAYSHTFPVGSGDPPYTFSITAGSLPAGLSLNASTGVVSGTPKGPGTFSFTIQVTDSFTATASVACSISISGGSVQGGGTGTPTACCCAPEVSCLEESRQARADARQGQWPYSWMEPPPGSKHVFRSAVIAAPLTSARTLILAYQVPNTLRFCFHSVVLWYTNVAGPAPFGPWVPGDGSVEFSIRLNNSTNAADAAQGRPFKDYGSILFPMGSPVMGAALIEPGELSIIESRDVLCAYVTVDPAAIQGGFFTAIFRGWTWPNS